MRDRYRAPRLREIAAWEWDEIDAAIEAGECDAEAVAGATPPRAPAVPLDPTMPAGFLPDRFDPFRCYGGDR